MVFKKLLVIKMRLVISLFIFQLRIYSEGEILEGEAGNGAGSLEGSVPYRQALPQYREAAVEAAQDADLPAYARQWVETYFDALAQ